MVDIENTDQVLATPAVDEEGRDIKTGKFCKGNVVARRKKGKRNKIHQALLDHVIKRGEQGLYFFEALSEIADDNKANPELRFKAEQQLGNWALNPNFQVVAKDEDEVNDSQLKGAILGILSGGAVVVVDDGDDEEAPEVTE